MYVGKATSLKNRVKSYFLSSSASSVLRRGKGRPVEEMISEITSLEVKQADSALEAAILESIIIKKYQPRYNVLGKDDKSWNFLVITNEEFPKLQAIRQHEYESLKHENTRTLKHVFGPFPGLNTKATITLLRKMFLFSTCAPNKCRPCLYREIGQCLGVCTGEISAKEYSARVIKPLVLFLSGKKKQVIQFFERQMQVASKKENYETAVRLRDQIAQLKRIHDMSILNDSFFKDPNLILEGPTQVRIEGYDISNLGATEKVGSMVVFKSSGPVKSDYRKFIVKTVPGQSDVDSLKEVLSRRLSHAEWPFPTIFLIDGGKLQVSAASEVLKRRGVNIPIIGIAKGRKRKRNDLLPEVRHVRFGALGSAFTTKDILFRWLTVHTTLLISVRDEAHRFAIAFHRSRLRSLALRRDKGAKNLIN